MKRKVKDIALKYCSKLQTLENVEAVILGEIADVEIFDPYFIIELDVYYEGDLPKPGKRKELLENPVGLESSPVHNVDRFMDNDLPVIILYKKVSSIDAIFDRIEKEQYVFRQESTSMLYRIEKGRILYAKSGWFQARKDKLDTLSDVFWENYIAASKFLAENNLIELGIAVLKSNSVLYQNALSGFMQNVCGCVFALNRQFEPPAIILLDEMRKLAVLPHEFVSRFESICKPDNEYAADRKADIAKLIAKSLISMELEA